MFNFKQTFKKCFVAIPTDVFCCWGHHKSCSCNRYNRWGNLSRKTVMSHINVYCVLLDFICFYYFWCVFMTSYPGTLEKMAVASVFLSALEPFWQDLCISMEIRKGHQWNNWLLHLHHDSWAHPISIQFNAWWIQPLSKKDTHSNQAYCHRSSPSIMVFLVLTITKPSHIYQLVQSHWTVSVRERSDLWLSC